MKSKSFGRYSLAYKIFTVFNFVLLAAIAALCVLPLVHILAISLSGKGPVEANLIGLTPKQFTWDSYSYVFHTSQFWASLKISVLRTVLGTALTTVLTILLAYPLSRPQGTFRGRWIYMSLVIVAMLFSGGLVPTYIIVTNVLKLGNTIWALVLPCGVQIFSAIMMMNFFRMLPRTIEEAAYIDGADHKLGIIASGIAFNYLMECYPDGCPYPVLKISQYPLPKKLIRRMTDDCEYVLIAEEGQPFIEDQVRGVMPGNAIIKGRLTGELPRTGELNPDCLKRALGLESSESYAPCEDVTPRPPALCQGCGHRDVYTALNEVLREYPNARVFGDIGCYTLGFLPPYKAIHSCVDMGASITMAKGASDAGQWPAVAIIGDSTFTHSGMTGLLDAINENADITVIISDNLTTAMTGGQDSAGTNKFEAICKGLGLSEDHLKVVNPIPKNMPEITQAIRDEINYHGVSVIIPRRECMQTLQRHLKQKKNNK